MIAYEGGHGMTKEEEEDEHLSNCVLSIKQFCLFASEYFLPNSFTAQCIWTLAQLGR